MSSAPIKNSDAFFDSLATRRTIYALGKDSPVSDARVKELIEKVLLHTPSPWNVQSNRVIALFGAEHEAFWQTLVTEAYKKVMPKEAFEQHMAGRFQGFAKAQGTVLWFEDQAALNALAEKNPAVAQSIPTWGEHTSAMHQFALWVALSAEGAGASLQHNVIVEKSVLAKYGAPELWSLKAMSVFGKPLGPPVSGPNNPRSVGDRLKVFGASA